MYLHDRNDKNIKENSEPTRQNNEWSNNKLTKTNRRNRNNSTTKTKVVCAYTCSSNEETQDSKSNMGNKSWYKRGGGR